MLRVRLLGELALERDGAPLPVPSSRRARALLAWLALHPGPHARARVAARFWPDVLDSSARASLREALATLRRELPAPAAEHLVATAEQVGLEDVETDVAELERRLHDRRFEEAVELGDAELLPALDDPWVHQAREALHDRLAAALEDLAARADAAGAVTWTRRLVAREPLSEDATRRLMRRLAAAGDRAAALAAYTRLTDRLAADLRIAPSAPTRELAEEIRAGGTPDTPLAERPVVVPPVRYATSGELSIAYQVLGEGPVDLVYVPGFVWHGEAVWSTRSRSASCAGWRASPA
jgi:DNA-binding SARP family transcriptional activator